jgi:hypothetical protein
LPQEKKYKGYEFMSDLTWTHFQFNCLNLQPHNFHAFEKYTYKIIFLLLLQSFDSENYYPFDVKADVTNYS